MTTMNRRKFLIGASQVALLTSLLPSCAFLPDETWLVSACKDANKRYFVAAIDIDGNLVSKVRLPNRGHDLIGIPNKPGRALVFGRRPNRFAMEVDFNSGKIVQEISSQFDSHFFGHGVLSLDGEFLYTTENLYDQKQGMITVRETQSYAVVDRFYSYGIGPHQLKMMPDGESLVVASGGILTHPDWPRMKLNIPKMASNLAYINRHSGELIDSVNPPDHQLSLRHLDVSASGQVTVGAQYEGKKSKIQPLVYSHSLGQPFKAFAASPEQWQKMHQYTASVLVAGNIVCISCPRGNNVTFFDLENKNVVSQHSMTDVAGLSMLNGKVMASSGIGEINSFNGDVTRPIIANLKSDVLHFDNHMSWISSV